MARNGSHGVLSMTVEHLGAKDHSHRGSDPRVERSARSVWWSDANISPAVRMIDFVVIAPAMQSRPILDTYRDNSNTIRFLK